MEEGRELWWIKSYRLSNSIGNTPTERLQHLYKELYAQHPPSTPDNSSSLGWMKLKRKEKISEGGKKKNEWNSILDIRSDTKMATDWKLS